jgi:CRISPR-associated protein Cas2
MMSMKSGCRRSLKFAKSICHIIKIRFSGEITPSKLIGLKTDLKQVIQEDEDFICIIKLFNENVFGEEVLGKKDRENGEQLIL